MNKIFKDILSQSPLTAATMPSEFPVYVPSDKFRQMLESGEIVKAKDGRYIYSKKNVGDKI